MENTFILYVFDIVRLYIFNNMFSQTSSSLTLIKPRIHDKNGQREYIDQYDINEMLHNLYAQRLTEVYELNMHK
jgi:hypothetical protein